MPPNELPDYVPTFWQKVRWVYDDVSVLQQKLRLAIGAHHEYKVAILAGLIEQKGRELVELMRKGE